MKGKTVLVHVHYASVSLNERNRKKVFPQIASIRIENNGKTFKIDIENKPIL